MVTIFGITGRTDNFPINADVIFQALQQSMYIESHPSLFAWERSDFLFRWIYTNFSAFLIKSRELQPRTVWFNLRLYNFRNSFPVD